MRYWRCRDVPLHTPSAIIRDANLTRPELDSIKAAKSSLNSLFGTKFDQRQRDLQATVWNLFQKTCLLSILFLGLHGLDNSWHVDFYLRMVECRLRALCKALEHQDLATFQSIYQDVHNGTREMAENRLESLRQLLDLLDKDDILDGSLDVEPSKYSKFEHTFSDDPPTPTDDDPELRVEDHIYEKYNVNGQSMRRLITPQIVSSSLCCWSSRKLHKTSLFSIADPRIGS